MSQRPSIRDRARSAAWDRSAVPGDVYSEIEQALASAESPVGIDAKHTHILILHALDRIDRRLEGGGQTAPAPREEREAEVRRQVRALLESSPAYAELKPKRRTSLDRNLTAVVMLAAEGSEATDFPGFVADLIQEVFQAVVDSSIKQMEAYGKLLADVTAGVDEFVAGAESRVARSRRQQLLATMVLMGVNRIDVRRGAVRTRKVFRDEEDDD